MSGMAIQIVIGIFLITGLILMFVKVTRIRYRVKFRKFYLADDKFVVGCQLAPQGQLTDSGLSLLKSYLEKMGVQVKLLDNSSVRPGQEPDQADLHLFVRGRMHVLSDAYRVVFTGVIQIPGHEQKRLIQVSGNSVDEVVGNLRNLVIERLYKISRWRDRQPQSQVESN